MTTDFFNQLQAACELAGRNSWIEPATEDSPVPQMHVLAHVDAQGRNYLVRLLADLEPQAEGAPALRTRMVDMALILPFPVAVRALPDTTRLLNAINLGGLIGAFALSEVDAVVLLHHTWHAPLAEIDAGHALALLDLLVYHATDAAPMIEQVASGAGGFDDIATAVQTRLREAGVTL